MSEATDGGRGGLFVRAIVVFLVAVSVFASYSLISSQGLTPAVLAEVVVTLYVSVLVCYGVFWDRLNSRRFRLALYVGVVLWGTERFLTGSESILSVVLIFGGLGLLVRELYFTD